ncbi:MAG: hypothetical protein ABIJ56_17920, partial [Pseudomonadota bacterium]
VVFDPGIYRIKVAKVGYEPFVSQVNVVSGAHTDLEVDLKKIEGDVSIEPEEPPEKIELPEVPQEEPAKPRQKKKLANSYKWLIGGLVSGGLIAIGAVATGAVGLNEQNAMEDEAAKCPSTAEREDCPEAYLHRDKAGDLQLGTNVLIAGAAAAGALGLIMFFVEWNKEKKLKGGKDLEDNASATIMLDPGRMIGAGMELRF